MGAWSDADAEIRSGGAKCARGRPSRHAGRCAGSTSKQSRKVDGEDRPVQPARPRLQILLEQEVQASHRIIAKLKAEIRARKVTLLEVEARLGPVIKLLDTYNQLALRAPSEPAASAEITAPTPTPAAKPNLVAPSVKPPRASVARDTDNEDDYEPIETEFHQVAAWASVRNMPFRTWDDLPAINARREEFELPPFKRKLSNGAAYRIGAR